MTQNAKTSSERNCVCMELVKKIKASRKIRLAYQRLDPLREIIAKYCKLNNRNINRIYDEKNLHILPHEGIGDLISILPALNYLSNRGILIKIHLEEKKFEAVAKTFSFPNGVACIHFNHNKSYQERPITELLKHTNLVKLGHYEKYPIYKYPLSFYDQLNVPHDVAREAIVKKHTYSSVNYKDNQDYIYVNLSNSVNVSSIKFDEFPAELESYQSYDQIVGSPDGTVKLYRKNIYVETFDLDGNTFGQNIDLALGAKLCVVSDAAIYNSLIRMNRHPNILVKTRNHIHTHDCEIYKHPFDGKFHFVKEKKDE